MKTQFHAPFFFCGEPPRWGEALYSDERLPFVPEHEDYRQRYLRRCKARGFEWVLLASASMALSAVTAYYGTLLAQLCRQRGRRVLLCTS